MWGRRYAFHWPMGWVRLAGVGAGPIAERISFMSSTAGTRPAPQRPAGRCRWLGRPKADRPPTGAAGEGTGTGRSGMKGNRARRWR